MSVLVCVEGRDNSKLLGELKRLLPNVKIEEWPSCQDLSEVEFVLAWRAPSELWPQLTNLKVVQSYGAGVDAIDLSLIPEQVQVTRIVDEQLADDMAEYVLTHVLAHKLRLKEYFAKQQQAYWKPRRAYKHKHVGILGMGELGLTVAERLTANGFKVSGWSRSHKQLPNIQHFAGNEGLSNMLPSIDYLICLLPLTEGTKGVLNTALFKQLPSHCVVINVARGQHLIESDLLYALENKEIAAAVLDVFDSEPLPVDSPLWKHEQVTVTPHCAALTELKTVCHQIADNVMAQQTGGMLKNVICKTRGY